MFYRHIFLCVNFSYNNRLCYLEENQTTHIGLCGNSKELVCLSESGYLYLCSNLTQHIPTLNPSQFSGIDKLYHVNSILKSKQYPIENETDSLSTFKDFATVINRDDSSILSITQEPVISSKPKNQSIVLNFLPVRSSILNMNTTEEPAIYNTPKNEPTMLSFPQDRSHILNTNTTQESGFSSTPKIEPNMPSFSQKRSDILNTSTTQEPGFFSSTPKNEPTMLSFPRVRSSILAMITTQEPVISSTPKNEPTLLSFPLDRSSILSMSKTQQLVISSTPKNEPTMLSFLQDQSNILSIQVNSTSNIQALENLSFMSHVYSEKTSVDQKVDLRNNDTGSPAALFDWLLFNKGSKRNIEAKFTPLCTKTGKITGDFSECTDSTANKTVCLGTLSGKMLMCKEHDYTDALIAVCTEVIFLLHIFKKYTFILYNGYVCL